MPELKKIENDSAVANYTPQEGFVTQFFAEDESGNITLNLKLPDGTILPLSGGGSSGGGAVYFKCASIDTVNKTWTGYRAVLTDGVYSFEGTETTGLIYGTAFTPAENSIYNTDATVYVKKLFTGKDPTLVFHAPLVSAAPTAETGQVLTTNGEVQYGSVSGRACAYFSSDTVSVTADLPEFPTLFPAAGTPLSILGWFYFEDVWNALNMLFLYGNEIEINSCDGALRVSGPGFDVRAYGINSNEWIHVAVVSDGSILHIYINGEEKGSGQHSLLTTAGHTLRLGGCRPGALADIRIYDRVLSSDEIVLIAAGGE